MKKVSIIFIIFSISIIISCKNYIEYADSNFCKNKEITYPNISLILLSNEKEYILKSFLVIKWDPKKKIVVINTRP